MKGIILSKLIVTLVICATGSLSAQQNDVSNKIDEYIDAYIQMNQFSGSILISKKDSLIMCKGYGLASHQFNVGNSPETKFRIASLTKGFTAIAIIQLVENNKLSLDTKLIEFFPDLTRGDEIAIKHLLTMTSGIPNHTEFQDFNTDRRVYHHSALQTINTFKSKALRFKPGEKFEYSNSNYILLGYIIEQISSMKYAEYIKQYIFEPLGMKDSGFEKPENIIDNMAQGYCFRNNVVENANFRNMSNAHASGALYSTIKDLYKWDRALYTNKLISYKNLETIFTPFKENYAFGWGIVDVFNHNMIAHTGEIDGFASNISRFPDEDICVIILSNFEHTPINRINRDLIAMLFGEKYAIPEVVKTIKLSDETLKTYVGDYELQPGLVFSISFSDGSLYCQPTGQPKLILAPVSKSVFMLNEVDAKISFEKNSSQEIEKLILQQGDRQFPAPKIK